MDETIANMLQSESWVQGKQEKKEEVKVYQVKKNQIDSMAGFFYGFGNTLIHFSLLITAFFIKGPDFKKAKALDRAFFVDLENILFEKDEFHFVEGNLNIEKNTLKTIE